MLIRTSSNKPEKQKTLRFVCTKKMDNRTKERLDELDKAVDLVESGVEVDRSEFASVNTRSEKEADCNAVFCVSERRYPPGKKGKTDQPKEIRWLVGKCCWKHHGHLALEGASATEEQKQQLTRAKQRGVPIRAALADLRAQGVDLTPGQAYEIMNKGNRNLTDAQQVLDGFSTSPSDVAVVRPSQM
jgi:hypothetical protein